jgi:hypothetical protein
MARMAARSSESSRTAIGSLSFAAVRGPFEPPRPILRPTAIRRSTPATGAFGEFGPPADYAYHPDENIEFELDYIDWRDDQLRSHDREYAQWRADQQRRYDEEYRTFRSQRRDHFERSFADWRSQQDPLTAPETEGAAPPPEDKV